MAGTVTATSMALSWPIPKNEGLTRPRLAAEDSRVRLLKDPRHLAAPTLGRLEIGHNLNPDPAARSSKPRQSVARTASIGIILPWRWPLLDVDVGTRLLSPVNRSCLVVLEPHGDIRSSDARSGRSSFTDSDPLTFGCMCSASTDANVSSRCVPRVAHLCQMLPHLNEQRVLLGIDL
ncbi:hypothetical protein ZHAS_00011882 [Anopheles sinensis]|uniref:Uncharacterized protein n=1 Tax=Anopheles sinensis TaxID=74873 RepID=A0A084W1F7_ANOSI|nr:hypothetical protein ZHAS_00011882 [Anopheles sinensis]